MIAPAAAGPAPREERLRRAFSRSRSKRVARRARMNAKDGEKATSRREERAADSCRAVADHGDGVRRPGPGVT